MLRICVPLLRGGRPGHGVEDSRGQLWPLSETIDPLDPESWPWLLSLLMTSLLDGVSWNRLAWPDDALAAPWVPEAKTTRPA